MNLLRSIACLLVLAHHLFQYAPAGLDGWIGSLGTFFTAGSFGVSLFFMLSGNLLSQPYWQATMARSPMPSAGDYLLRRTARIVPAYWLVLVVSALLAVTLFGFDVTNDLLIRLAAGLFFVSYLSAGTFFPVPVNGPLWTISLEVFCYLALPLLFSVIAPRRRVLLAGSVITLVCMLLHGVIVSLATPENPPISGGQSLAETAAFWFPRYSPAGFLTIFMLGVLSAGIGNIHAARLGALAANCLVVTSTLVAGSIMWIAADAHATPEAFGLLGIPYGFPAFQFAIAVLLVAMPHSPLIGRIEENRLVVALANISFGTYLWQVLVIETVREVLGVPFPMQSMGQWAAMSAISVVGTFLFATMSWLLVEAPIRRATKHLSARRPVSTSQSVKPTAAIVD